MSDNKNVNQDKGLQGNEKIEQAIAALQQEATQEMLAHTLTVIRRRMRENGQFILSVEPPTGDNQLRIGTVKTGDGKVWWAAFTSFEEELRSSPFSSFASSISLRAFGVSLTAIIDVAITPAPPMTVRIVEPLCFTNSFETFNKVFIFLTLFV